MAKELMSDVWRSVVKFMDRKQLESFIDFQLFEGGEDNANGFVRIHEHNLESLSLTVVLFEESQRVRSEITEMISLIDDTPTVECRIAVCGPNVVI